MKITEYRLWCTKDKFEFTKHIDELIEHYGFQPYGDPFIFCDFYHQVMVKYESEKESFDKSLAAQITDLKKDIDDGLKFLEKENLNLKRILQIERECSTELTIKSQELASENKKLNDEIIELKTKIRILRENNQPG